MPTSRVVCPKCKTEFEAQWLPYPAPEVRVGKKALKKCPNCGKRSLVDVVTTQISED